MNIKALRVFFFLCSLILCSLLITSCGKSKPRIPAALAAPKLHSLRREAKQLPFKAGEKLTYDLRFSRPPISLSAGSITFENFGVVAQPKIEKLEFTPSADERFLHLKASLITKGLLLRIFGLSVNDRFETLVDAKDFKPRAVLRESDESKRHRLQTGLFDYEKQIANYRIIDVDKPQNPVREKNPKLEPDMQDLLSAFYLLRLQEAKENSIYKFPLLYEGERREFEIVIYGREEIQLDLGKFKTIKVEPKLFGPGRLSSREGELFMWVTDDAVKTPVKLVMKSSGATITATLTKKE